MLGRLGWRRQYFFLEQGGGFPRMLGAVLVQTVRNQAGELRRRPLGGLDGYCTATLTTAHGCTSPSHCQPRLLTKVGQATLPLYMERLCSPAPRWFAGRASRAAEITPCHGAMWAIMTEYIVSKWHPPGACSPRRRVALASSWMAEVS